MAVDMDGDGMPDVIDSVERVVLMEGARVLEAMLRRRQMTREAAAHAAADEARAARARLAVEAQQSRHRLGPVMGDQWWAKADVEQITSMYAEAKSWEHDPSFDAYVSRIEDRAKQLHDLDPEQLLHQVKIRDREALTLDSARALAEREAPSWYRTHDELKGDMPPFLRERAEQNLVADMTVLRDTGKLDTEHAKMEWAKFSGHTPALREHDPNETLTEYKDAIKSAAAEHWDKTTEQRAALPVGPLSPGAATRPMTTLETKQFAEQFAPDWVMERHLQLRSEQLYEHPAENNAHTVRMDDQLRYAMEHLRDTGTLDHPYVKSMRETLALDPDVDTALGPKPVSSEQRVRFGGAADALPITRTAAFELMHENAPDWYVKHMEPALSPETDMTPTQREGVYDTLRSDMQRLRDRGVLDTDNAMKVWASQQSAPGAEGGVDVWAQDVSRPVTVWAQTATQREQPKPLTREQLDRFGGAAEHGAAAKPVRVPTAVENGPRTEPLPVVDAPKNGKRRREQDDFAKLRAEAAKGGDEPKKNTYDTVERRDRDAAKMKSAGLTGEEIKIAALNDWNHAHKGGLPGKGSAPARSKSGLSAEQTQENTRTR